MKHQYIPINSIFSKFIRDVTSDFNEDDIIEWCGEALDFIGAVQAYEEAVAFIEVQNHQALLPTGLHKIIQVARNNGYTKCTPLEVCTEAPEPCNITPGTNPCVCPPSDAVWLDCEGKPIVAYELAYYRPYFDLKAEFIPWNNSTYYRKNFTPVRLSNHSLFNTIVTEGVTIDTPYDNTTRDEYTIILKNIIRTSFKEGQICVSYLRQVRDPETGYPMIPDNISYKTAITKYLTMMVFTKEFYSGRDGAKGKLDKAESDWQWYCGQASNIDKMLTGVDDYQDLHEQRIKLIPNNNKYFGFFGNTTNGRYAYNINNK